MRVAISLTCHQNGRRYHAFREGTYLVVRAQYLF